MARSAWLFPAPTLLAVVQLVALTVSPSRVFMEHGYDFGCLLSFELPPLQKLGGSFVSQLDVDLLSSARNIDTLHRRGIANPAACVTSAAWFSSYVRNTTLLTESVEKKCPGHNDRLAILVRYLRMHHAGRASHNMDPVRAAEKFTLNEDVAVDHPVARRLIRTHRTGTPLDLAASRVFDPTITNLPETVDHMDLLLKALRKLVVIGMVIF